MSAAFVSSSFSIANEGPNFKIWCLIAGSQKLSAPRTGHTQFLKGVNSD